MTYRRTEFGIDEYYHCFSRGVDKRITFTDSRDFRRFEELLYLANSTLPVSRFLMTHLTHEQILEIDRGTPLVSIGAYCLMPNHFHLLLREISEGGITAFMRKLGTGYTMYFNTKHHRIGNLFVKPFRSKHIKNDPYLRKVAQYIHLNPVELFEPSWKQGAIRNPESLKEKCIEYAHSSLVAHCGILRPENVILDKVFVSLLSDETSAFSDILADTSAYYAELQ